MDPRIAIWNTLHDGEITVVSLDGKETLVMFVGIPYLRERLAPLGDSFVLRLSGFRQLEFTDFEGKKKASELEDISKGGIEILSTHSKTMPVKVETTMGYLILDFDRIEIALDTGQVVEYETVLRACTEYWDEWSAKSKAAIEAKKLN